MQDTLPTKMYITEKSTKCGRTCSFASIGHRELKYTVFEDGANGQGKGNVLMTHEKNCTCPTAQLVWVGDGGPIYCPCCNFCGLPYLSTKNASGVELGKSQYVCDACCFVPRFDVYDNAKRYTYRVRPKTCCAGCCVACKCGGEKGQCCRVPFYIREPQSPFKPLPGSTGQQGEQGMAQICDLWAGWEHECCTKRNAYAIKLPAAVVKPAGSAYDFSGNDPQANMAATLMGMALLVDITCFEQQE